MMQTSESTEKWPSTSPCSPPHLPRAGVGSLVLAFSSPDALGAQADTNQGMLPSLCLFKQMAECCTHVPHCVSTEEQ